MVIGQAKEQIQNTVRIYLKKDAYGDYCLPSENQRPIFLMGPPGIGKSAIMEQIASSMDIAIVSYSMAHHTRQSALGLPLLEQRTFEGKDYTACEYSMSEIIGSIYSCMEASGIREGILFLDEINCISDTLMPSMLQFLQFKRFGEHRLPAGWIVVAAGNPPEYNRSAKNLDVVTLDRMKVLQVETDYETWRSYAVAAGVHRSILGYLDGKSDHFYSVEIEAGQRQYATARGWEDLSRMIFLMEEEGMTVDLDLIFQYIHHSAIAPAFSAHYELYNKYRTLFSKGELKAETLSAETIRRLRRARFDEKTALVHLAMEPVVQAMGSLADRGQVLRLLRDQLQGMEGACQEEGDCLVPLNRILLDLETQLQRGRAANTLSASRRRTLKEAAFLLGCLKEEARKGGDPTGPIGYQPLKEAFNRLVSQRKTQGLALSARLEAALLWIETAFDSGREMLMAITELAADPSCAAFLFEFGSPLYDKHSDALLLDQRREALLEKLEALN